MKLDKLHWLDPRDRRRPRALRGVTSLQVLVLNRTRVTDAGLVQLKGLTQLKELYLDGTDVTAAGRARAEKIASGMPDHQGDSRSLSAPRKGPPHGCPRATSLLNGRDLKVGTEVSIDKRSTPRESSVSRETSLSGPGTRHDIL